MVPGGQAECAAAPVKGHPWFCSSRSLVVVDACVCPLPTQGGASPGDQLVAFRLQMHQGSNPLVKEARVAALTRDRERR